MIVFLYLLAVVLANLSAAYFGPQATIINAFLLIGLDLTARDKLHDKWKNNNLVLKMLALILAGSVISFVINQNAIVIGIASAIAFASAAVSDTLVYNALFSKPRLQRINASNVVSAFVDSIVFPTVAFGAFMPAIVAGQFLAKVVGGFLWSLVLNGKEEKVQSA